VRMPDLDDERYNTDGTRHDRRRYERDWVPVIAIIVSVVLAVVASIGVPLIYWGSGVNSTTAVLASRIDKQDRDITDLRNSQFSLSTSLSEVKTTLAVIGAEVSAIGDNLKNGRYQQYPQK
jgi:hypothetical protein